jgi:hypothetical protein
LRAGSGRDTILILLASFWPFTRKVQEITGQPEEPKKEMMILNRMWLFTDVNCMAGNYARKRNMSLWYLAFVIALYLI